MLYYREIRHRVVAVFVLVSAPTVRFLRAIEQLRPLPEVDRRKLAASIYSEIKPHIGTDDYDGFRRAAGEAQDGRWRMASTGAETSDPQLTKIKIAEQWLLSQAELLRPPSPVAEVLATKRIEVIERFIRDHLSFDAGEVIYLTDCSSSEFYASTKRRSFSGVSPPLKGSASLASTPSSMCTRLASYRSPRSALYM